MWGDSLLPAIEKFDLATYCAEHGGDELQPGEWTLFCPSCGKDKLVVNVQKKTWHCWVCQKMEWIYTSGGFKKKALAGAGGLIDLIQFLDQKTRQEAVVIILRQDLLDPSLLRKIPDGEVLVSRHLENDFQSLAVLPAIPYPESPQKFFRPPMDMVEMAARDVAWRYANLRGITDEDIEFFGLFFCNRGRYQHRLVFPVYENRTFVYFQARAMWEPRPGERFVKSLNPPRIEEAAVSSDVLFNYDNATACPVVCITEGPIDAIHAGWDAVATFGKQISGMQIAKLVKAGVKHVQLMWDADALQDMLRVAPLLSVFFESVSIVQLPCGDPGNFTRGQNAEFRARAWRYDGRLMQI
jgi:hypothetical protein